MTATTSPVAVVDTFHFSHYYWRELEGTGSGDTSDDDSTTPTFKPKPVTKDTIKLKFYAQGELINYCIGMHCHDNEPYALLTPSSSSSFP